jgi:hypothetical protein
MMSSRPVQTPAPVSKRGLGSFSCDMSRHVFAV